MSFNLNGLFKFKALIFASLGIFGNRYNANGQF